jgi:hypothetical protein
MNIQSGNHDIYKPQPPLITPEYSPLIVTPVPSKSRPGEVVAHLGRQLCFFEKGNAVPEAGKPVEIMIIRPLYHKNEFGHPDHMKILALLVRVVTKDYTLIDHDGFECAGSMCRTTARMTGPAEHSRHGSFPWLTPGRTGIFEASNVSAGYTWKVPYTPLRPGKIYVSTEKLKSGDFPLRAEGLARLEDASYAFLCKTRE